MKHQWNGEIPSPGGKVARRKPGRMRNGDAVGQGMHPNKTDKGFGFNHFYGVHRNILLFAVPHQSPKSVPKCRFGRQLYELRCDCHWQSIDFDSLRGAPPPGEAMSAAAPIRYTTVNVLTKADNQKPKNGCPPAPIFSSIHGIEKLEFEAQGASPQWRAGGHEIRDSWAVPGNISACQAETITQPS